MSDNGQRDLPPGWEWTRIGEVADVVGGGTPSTNDLANYEGGDIAWVTPADLSGYSDKYIAAGARHITEKGLRESSARLMPPGTVLLSSRAPVGYVAIASQSMATNQGFKSFVLPDGLDSSYLYYYLKFAKDLILTFASGTTFLEVSGKNAAQIPLPVAPLIEQRRIVAAIEEQFTRLDAAVAALKRSQANLKRYRASVLAAACSGRLVPTEADLARREGRDFEPADRLLERILIERRVRWEADQLARMQAQGKPPKGAAWKGKYTEPQAPEKDGLLELPDGWGWATVEQIGLIQGGIQKQPKRAPKDNPYPFLRVANVLRGRLNLHDVHQVELFGEELATLRLEKDDLLIIEGNGSPSEIGRMAIWTGTIENCVHQNHIIRVRPVIGVLSRYFESYWNSPRGSSLVTEVASSTSGLYTLSVGKINRLLVPLPPLAEQQRIVAEVERRLSVVEEMEMTVAHGLARAERLRQAVLRRAFAGRLVPQDPTDEPASVLLERIRAERAANGAGRQTRRGRATSGQQSLFDPST